MSRLRTEFVVEDLTGRPQLQGQPSLEQLGTLEHHSLGLETAAGVVNEGGQGLVEVHAPGQPRGGSGGTQDASTDTQAGDNQTDLQGQVRVALTEEKKGG